MAAEPAGRVVAGMVTKAYMLTLVLIRPGTTDYDIQERIQGNLDIPLSDAGSREVAELAAKLKPQELSVIYAPETQPAEQTARLLSKALEVRLRNLDGIDNIDLGLWQGMTVAEVRRKQPKVYRQWQEQPETVCPPNGEPLFQAEERLRPAIAKLLRRHPEGAVGVVVAEPMRNLVRRLLTHAPLGDLWRATQEHEAVEVLTVDPETVFQAIN